GARSGPDNYDGFSLKNSIALLGLLRSPTQGKPARHRKPAFTRELRWLGELGLNLSGVLVSYSAVWPVIQTAVFRLLPAQTTECICALERLSALG
ncbi:hypothetical protein, partial [Pseudomonas salomonii]|uniref:hypothetical protein n=1 Tax=Pseudomonas salomonii TaxID=191391 RepID=UPI001C80E0D0